MRCLFIFVTVCLSFAQASPFRFEPRISLLPETEELNEASCFSEASLQSMGTVGQGIAVLAEAAPEKACFVVGKTASEKVAHYFRRELSGLGYSKQTENFQPPGLYSSKWATTASSVLSFIWIDVELAPGTAGTVMFAFYNDGSLTLRGAKDTVEDLFSVFVEEARKRPDKPTHLKQETRFQLPLGTIELPADMCEPSVVKSTAVEFPLLSCYIVPLEVAQTLEHLGDNLNTLRYQQSNLVEETTFTGANWVLPGVETSKLTLLVFSTSLTKGSMLVEVNTKVLEESLR